MMDAKLFDLSLLPGAIKGAVRDGARVSYDFFKIIIPLTIVLKIVMEMGWLPYAALPLKPFTELVGLPADMGIAWAAGILVNLYSALFVFAGLLPTLPAPPTVEQMTVFALMTLIAHSLPLEGRIAQRCGVSFLLQTVLRVVVAVLTGAGLHWFAQFFGIWSEPAQILFNPDPPPPGIWAWIASEISKLMYMSVIICAVMLLQRGLRHFRISWWLGHAMDPVLRRMGMGPDAATTVVIGFCMGLIYGSGIIIKDAVEGSLTRREIFAAVTLISLSHALIEDTILMCVIGASLWGTVFLRILVSLALGVAINRIWMWRDARKTAQRHA